jgi:hypothetical protein
MSSGFRIRVAKQLLFTAFVLGLLLLAGPGCGPGDRPIAIRGKVTFQGQPVTEGMVQFNEAKTGHGAEAPLGPEGTYQATLPAGDYAVLILPPYLVVESKSGPPDPQLKKVKNIPEKYRSTVTSGLTAVVSPDKTVHDFDMKP